MSTGVNVGFQCGLGTPYWFRGCYVIIIVLLNAPASSSRMKEAEVDTTPAMTNTYTKAQRLKDEKNLRVSF